MNGAVVVLFSSGWRERCGWLVPLCACSCS